MAVMLIQNLLNRYNSQLGTWQILIRHIFLNSAGACVISLDFNVNLWHQSFSLENLAEQEKLWCQFFCEGLVCQNRLLIEPS